MGYKTKGPTKGQKEPSAPSLYSCIGVDFLSSQFKLQGVAAKMQLPLDAIKEHAPWATPDNIKKETGGNALPALFVMCLHIPTVSPSLWGQSQAEKDDNGFSVVFWWAIKQETLEVRLARLPAHVGSAARIFIFSPQYPFTNLSASLLSLVSADAQKC